MRIGIFLVMAGRKAGGPETYEIGLLRSLAALDRKNEYHVFCLSRAAQESLAVQQQNFQFQVLWPSIRWISVPLSLPAALRSSKVDFYHATYVPAPFSPTAYVFTVHDMSMFVNPEFYHGPLQWRLARLIRRGLKQARILLCISEYTRDLVAEKFRVPAERLAVVYHGVGEQFRALPAAVVRERLEKTYGLRGRYILFVGQLKTRSKNLIRLLEAFRAFREEGHADVRLVLVGRRNRTSVGLEEAIDRLQLKDHLTELGHVPDDDLPMLYNGAELLAFPSLVEGFGFPIIEAMACGTPVVTSNLASMPEVAGGAAHLVNPHSVQDIAAGIHRVFSDAALRESLRARGFNRARFFTWERTAQGTLEAYKRAESP